MFINIFIGMKKLIRNVLREEIEGKPQSLVMKYYMFDWDDNLMFMPTKIYLMTEDGEEIGMGTEPFAHYRNNIDPNTGKAKKPFEFDGEIIVGMADDAFRDFKSGLSEFVRDMKEAEIGPAWEDLVEAVNSASYLAVITARGHEPSVLKNALKFLIMNNVEGLSLESFYDSVKRFKKLLRLKIDSPEKELENYLDECYFYPVGYFYPEGGIKPEEVKAEAINEFKSSIEQLIGYINDRLSLLGIEVILKPEFGFSDDDLKNIEFSTKQIEGVNIYSTHGGEKKLVKKADIQLEALINKIINKLY